MDRPDHDLDAWQANVNYWRKKRKRRERLKGEVTVPEIVTALQVDKRTVYRWVATGQLRSHRSGKRRHRIHKTDLEAFLTARKPELLARFAT